MKSFKKILRSPLLSVALFAAAAALLLTGTIGGIRAARTSFYSETYMSRVEMHNIGVTLNENEKGVSWRDYGSESDGTWREHVPGELLARFRNEDGTHSFQLGTTYDERLSVTNSGTIDEFVRVTVYRYWEKDGIKQQSLDPALIDLHFVTGNGWEIDESSSTKERTVLYYNGTLAPGETTPILSDTLRVDGTALQAVTHETVSTETRDGHIYRTIVTTYDYDGVMFMLEAEVDAVQTHNAEDAIRSAWGLDMTVENGEPRLREGGAG